MRNTSSPVRDVTVLVTLLALSACAVDARSRESPKAQAQAASAPDLPHVMRRGFKGTMSRHAEQASALTVSVALGDHDATSRHATDLLEEPSLVAPSEADPGALNQQIPAKFFVLNEHFRVAVGKLRDAARARSDEQTRLQFGAVLQACRDCHRTFKNPTKPH